MAHQAPPQAAGPRSRTKWVVSLLIVLHFLAVLSFVTAAGNEAFPGFQPSVYVSSRVSKHYLQKVFLTNGYRFYAPNPGPTDLVWFRIEYENLGIRWYDMGDRASFHMRMPYQRHMSLSMMLAQMSGQDPATGTAVLSPEAVVCLQSYVRHVAQTKPAVRPDGQPNRVKEIDVYHIAHLIAEPTHIRMGWDGEDLRLYRINFLGGYDATGRRTDISSGQPEHQTNTQRASILFGQIFSDTRYLLDLEDMKGDERRAAAERLHLPLPVRKVIARFPELLEAGPAGETSADRVRRLVESQDNQEEKRQAVPGLHYPVEW